MTPLDKRACWATALPAWLGTFSDTLLDRDNRGFCVLPARPLRKFREFCEERNLGEVEEGFHVCDALHESVAAIVWAQARNAALPTDDAGLRALRLAFREWKAEQARAEHRQHLEQAKAACRAMVESHGGGYAVWLDTAFLDSFLRNRIPHPQGGFSIKKEELKAVLDWYGHKEDRSDGSVLCAAPLDNSGEFMFSGSCIKDQFALRFLVEVLDEMGYDWPGRTQGNEQPDYDSAVLATKGRMIGMMEEDDE